MSDVEVAVEATADVLARWPDPPLTPTERARSEALHDPSDFIAAHLLAREVAGRLLAVPPEQVVVTQRCDECGLVGHGRPSAPGCALSWSHAPGRIAAAAALRPVGIDLELLGQELHPGLVGRFCTRGEAAVVRAAADPAAAYLAVWTCKEALVKVGALSLDTFGGSDAEATAHAAGFTLQQLDYPGVIVSLATSR